MPGGEPVNHVRTLALTLSDVGSRGLTISDFGLKGITQELRGNKAEGSSNKAIEIVLCQFCSYHVQKNPLAPSFLVAKD